MQLCVLSFLYISCCTYKSVRLLNGQFYKSFSWPGKYDLLFSEQRWGIYFDKLKKKKNFAENIEHLKENDRLWTFGSFRFSSAFVKISMLSCHAVVVSTIPYIHCLFGLFINIIFDQRDLLPNFNQQYVWPNFC